MIAQRDHDAERCGRGFYTAYTTGTLNAVEDDASAGSTEPEPITASPDSISTVTTPASDGS